MKRIFFQIFLLLIFTIPICAQKESRVLGLVDEFGKANSEEWLARLDGFASDLIESPNSKGLIEIYGAKKYGYSSPFVRGSYFKAYLTNHRKIDRSRFDIRICNSELEIRHRLYIFQPGQEILKCEDGFYIPRSTTRIGQRNEFPPEFIPESGCCDVIGSDEAVNEMILELTNRIIQGSKFIHFHLISYAGDFEWTADNTDENGNWKPKSVEKLDTVADSEKFLDKVKQELISQGATEDQITTEFGGVRTNGRVVDIWFLPEGGEVPKATPDYIKETDVEIVDMFGWLPWGDFNNRINILANILKTDKEQFGIIKISGGIDQNPSFTYLTEFAIRSALHEDYGIPEKRIQI